MVPNCNSPIVSVKSYRLRNGANGKITKYQDGHTKFFWFFPFGTIYKSLKFKDQGFIFNIQTTGVAEDHIRLSGMIPPNQNAYTGRAKNVAKFSFTIEKASEQNRLRTPYMNPEPSKTVLTKHPSKHRAKHGGKTGIYDVISGGSMK